MTIVAVSAVELHHATAVVNLTLNKYPVEDY